MVVPFWGPLSIGIKIAQKPYIICRVAGPKALKYESFEAKSLGFLNILLNKKRGETARKTLGRECWHILQMEA